MENVQISRVNELEPSNVKVDLRDKKILSLLSEDARMPLSLISKRLRCSRDVVDYRIRRLVKKGIILGFVPMVNLAYFGYNTYHVFLVIRSSNSGMKQALINELVNHPNTRSVMEYHDSWDLEWVLVAKSLVEFDSIITDITGKFREVIVRKDKLTVIKGLKSIQLPGAIYRESSYLFKKKMEKQNLKSVVDKTDAKILMQLNNNSRKSTYDISKVLKISPDAVAYRMKKMHNSGVVFGFTILTNLNRLDYHLFTMCINIRNFDIRDEMRFREFISGNQCVLRAVKVLGDWDLLVYVTANSQEAFHQSFKGIQENLIDVISDHQTWSAYKEHAYNNIPPVIFQNFI